MKSFFTALMILIVFQSLGYTQENKIKNIYTNLTTKINSALLTSKSSIEVSGVLHFNRFQTNYNNDETQTHQALRLEPLLAYFIIDDLSLGINVSYNYDMIEYEQANTSITADQTFIGPIAKYYFKDKQLRPFLLLDYLFLAGDAYEGQQLGVGAGAMYHFAGNTTLTFQVKYGQIWSKQKEIDHQSRIFAGFGLSAFIF